MLTKGDKIKLQRESLAWTQKKFADFFGIPKRTLENWEENKCECPDIKFKYIELMCRKMKGER